MTREFVLKFLGDTTSLNRSLDESAGRLDRWGGRMTAVAGASVAAGAALEGLARGQQENTNAVERLTTLTGLQSDAVRTLANDLASVDSPLEEVLGLMEQGTRVGLESAESLEQYASFWDKVGDASGIAADELAQSTSVLQTVGIEVENLAEAEDALGFVLTDTTAGVDGFLGLLERKGPAIAEFGLNIDDAAALTAIFERELGFTGRAGLAQFEQALNESDGSLEGLLEHIGVSEETFREYRGQVDGASASLDGLAEANTSNFTPMQRLQHALSELTFKFGDQIGALAQLAPALLVIGPAMKGIQVAAGVLSVGLKASLLPLLLPPTGLIILGFAAVVAAGILIYKNWDTIKAKAAQLADWIGPKIGAVRDAIVGAFGDIAGAIQGAIDKIGDFLEMLGAIPSAAAEAASATANAVGSAIPGSGSAPANVLGDVVNRIPVVRAARWGWGQFGGGRASGGFVKKGVTYLVGEDGPELFTAKNDGRIHPSSIWRDDTFNPKSGKGGEPTTRSGFRINPNAVLDTSQIVDNRPRGSATPPVTTITVNNNGPTFGTSAEFERAVRRAMTNNGIRGIN